VVHAAAAATGVGDSTLVAVLAVVVSIGIALVGAAFVVALRLGELRAEVRGLRTELGIVRGSVDDLWEVADAIAPRRVNGNEAGREARQG
jgi:hypothetical protein